MRSDTPEAPGITYIINVMEGPRRVVPPITTHHPYGSYAPVFHDLLARVAELNKFAVIEVYTTQGLALISDEESWNEAIRTVYADESMDKTARVRIRIVEPIILDF